MSKLEYKPWEHDQYFNGFDWPSNSVEPIESIPSSPYADPSLADWVIIGHGPINTDNN